jgi:hypothetical protein
MITWKKDPFSSEAHEFGRITAEYTPDKKDLRNNLGYLQTQYNKARKVSIIDSDWRRLENTDSFGTNTMEEVYTALKRNNAPRDVDRILRQYVSGNVSCPIVMKFSDNRLVLVAGNTRLMIARVLKIKPKIILVETDW